MTHSPKDDALTLAALGSLAFAIADVSHEALGHGLATLAVGETPVMLTTCYFVSNGPYSRWIPAGGGIANAIVGIAALLALGQARRLAGTGRYFVVLLAAFNLFFAAGYPAYSGVALFGDWAAVISGLRPAFVWRGLLILVSVAGYFAALKLVGGAISPFAGADSSERARIRRITLIPFLAALLTACAAGALNPNGWVTLLTAGLPAAGASAGLTQMDHFVAIPARNAIPAPEIPAQQPMVRNWLWVGIAALVLALFVGVLGPGIRFK